MRNDEDPLLKPESFERSVLVWVTALYDHLDNVLQLVKTQGLFSLPTATCVCQAIPLKFIGNAKIHESVSDDKILNELDTYIDGYRIEHRKSVASVTNRWVYYYHNRHLFLVWLISQDTFGLLRQDHINVFNLEYNAGLRQDLRMYGVYPLREGLLPTPSPSRLRID